MKHAKIATMLAILMIAALVIAACGGGATPAPAETPTAQPPAPTPTPAPKLKIKVGTNAEYRPFEFVDETGKIVGFDIDLMDAIAKAAGFEYEFINTRWDGIFVALAQGEFDAVMSAATITEERKQTVDFSDPYFLAGQGLAVREGSDIKTLADVDGRKVGVQLGTTGDIFATENTKAIVVRYDEITLAMQALANGDVDAVLNDAPVSADIIKANPELKLVMLPEIYTSEEYGIAVNKNRPEVLAAINKGLAAVKASGEYDRIYEKWFGMKPPTTAAAPAAPAAEEDPCAYGGIIKDIVAVDELTVRFDLCVPDPAFPAKAADTALQIWPKEALTAGATSGSKAWLERPVGTGPYKIKEWRKGDQLILEANPDYWGPKPKAKTLVFRWSAEAAQRLLELQAGNVNGIDNPGPDDFAVIEADPNLKLYPRPGTNVFYIGMNNTYPPFDKERVRQAFAMAIDRQRIVDNYYPVGSIVATQFMPPSIFGYSEGLDWWEYNPEMARQILQEEGVYDASGKFKTKIFYRDVVRGYLPEPGVVAQDIQAQLAEIGVEAEIVVMESGAFLDAADAGQLNGFHLLGWGADYPDATNFLDYHFGAGASAQFGTKFDDLVAVLKEAASLADPAKRQPLYDKANALIKQHVPMIPVAHGGSATAWQAKCEGAHSSPLWREKLNVVYCGSDTLVFMQNAEPISLYCADETDGETFRACEQINEALLSYAVGTTNVEPALAVRWEANADLTSWTFYLRPGVKFHDGTTLDAEDVVTSWVAQWDAASPLHTGRVGDFTYFQAYFGAFKNAPK
ncbi:MAG: ABC transporter substrate-binding protein [Caldilineales bacterium]|nr:ABC transporter substrate-binding protein [Caldilineales bacterium]MDW8318061.1 ABC transporter substrate-binding protein [Anaerolineae bacterium]